MNPTIEQLQHALSQYQQWLANSQLQLAMANAQVAELESAAIADKPANA